MTIKASTADFLGRVLLQKKAIFILKMAKTNKTLPRWPLYNCVAYNSTNTNSEAVETRYQVVMFIRGIHTNV